jgi:hypothetical protein
MKFAVGVLLGLLALTNASTQYDTTMRMADTNGWMMLDQTASKPKYTEAQIEKCSKEAEKDEKKE